MDDAALPRAVVFAHGRLGARCLQVLRAGGVDVVLVVTHSGGEGDDDAGGSAVAALCRADGLPCIAEDDAGDAGLAQRVRAAQPAVLFCFGYRALLPAGLLAVAPAYNMHAALLPQFRGRDPVEWAVLQGAGVTGASLHEMTAAPNAGAIVSQMEVPLLPDDTAADVHVKVTVAAEQTLWRVLPALLAGHAPRLHNDLAQGASHPARGEAARRIDWRQPAQAVYRQYLACAQPGDGAYTESGGVRYVIRRARLGNVAALGLPPGLAVVDNGIFGVCGDGRMLAVLALSAQGADVTPAQLQAALQGRRA